MKLQWIKNEKVQIKVIFWMMVAILAVVLIPLFAIGYYNFRSVDDFSYAQSAEKVWRESGSVWKVLVAQISYTWDYYQHWQGTFFSEWLTTSVMGIFSEDAYYMSTWLTLGGFVISESVLLMTVFQKVLGADRYLSWIIVMSCMILQVLLVPYPCEAFFWFCGSMLYTFIHALAMILCTIWILLYFADNTKHNYRVRNSIILKVLLVLLTIAVAGSNYITALTVLLLYLFCSIWFLYKKHLYRVWIVGSNLLYVIAFLINILAPGNSVRQDASGIMQMGAVESIALSLKEAVQYIVTWSIFPVVMMGLLFLPLFWKMVQVRKFRYPWPFLVSLISFGVFAAQFTPTLYALGIIGAGRVQNLYRLNLFLLLYGNELYWVGWLASKLQEKKEEANRKISWILPGWCMGLVILAYSLTIWGGSTLTSVSALQSLRKGEAQRYYEQYQERLEVLADENIKDVELAPFSVKPYVLFFGDIVEDPEDWVNQHLAAYYGKNSVKLK